MVTLIRSGRASAVSSFRVRSLAWGEMMLENFVDRDVLIRLRGYGTLKGVLRSVSRSKHGGPIGAIVLQNSSGYHVIHSGNLIMISTVNGDVYGVQKPKRVH